MKGEKNQQAGRTMKGELAWRRKKEREDKATEGVPTKEQVPSSKTVEIGIERSTGD